MSMGSTVVRIPYPNLSANPNPYPKQLGLRFGYGLGLPTATRGVSARSRYDAPPARCGANTPCPEEHGRRRPPPVTEWTPKNNPRLSDCLLEMEVYRPGYVGPDCQAVTLQRCSHRDEDQGAEGSVHGVTPRESSPRQLRKPYSRTSDPLLNRPLLCFPIRF